MKSDFLKKFFDRTVFSRLGLQLVFSVLLIALFSLAGTLLRNWATGHSAPDVYSQTFWGFRQITDGGSMAGTLDTLDEVASESRNGYGAPVVLAVALLSWLVGMVLYGFVAGAVANAFAGRKDKIDAGEVRYRFRDHGVVIGWDFQGVAAVRQLFKVWEPEEVVVLSEQPAESIRSALAAELDSKTLRNVYVCRGSAGVEDDLRSLCVHRAKAVVILGDQNDGNNDAGNMGTSLLIREEIKRAEIKRPGTANPVHIYVDISDIYARRAMRRGLEDDKGSHVRLVNFFEDAASELFSSFDWRKEGGARPIRWRREAGVTHAHLVISGFGQMGQALVRKAVSHMGAGPGVDRITVFSTDAAATTRFRGAFPLDRLFNVSVEFVPNDIADPAVAARVGEIARDTSAAVTLAVCADTPDEALATFSSLPQTLRHASIRVLVEQRRPSMPSSTSESGQTSIDECIRIYLQKTGFHDVTFFGYTDRYLATTMKRDRGDSKAAEGTASPHQRVEEMFLETLAVCGFKTSPGAAGNGRLLSASLSDRDYARLAECSHYGRANAHVMDGEVPAPSTAQEKFECGFLHAWADLPAAMRDEWTDKWKYSFPLLEERLECGDRPLHIERDADISNEGGTQRTPHDLGV